ncbi:MAG TPA: hypothetical protein VJ873_00710 [bacterium]|nr:hypothetical protein [bacterium]
MSYLSSPLSPSIQESPSPYSPFSRKNVAYEILLQVSDASSPFKNLSNAHRLVQTLIQGELLGDYELWDFLIWPEGLLARVALKKAPSLSEFLKSLKEKSTPPEKDPQNFWENELRWIRLVTPERISESTRFFMETAESIWQPLSGFENFSPNLYFFYRSPRLDR